MSLMDALRSCKSIPGIEVRAVMINPDIATKLLGANNHNRKISTIVVTKYANEMNNDEWMLSAQGIGIDRNGVLCDGQHRLSAIIESKKTVPMLVVFGLAARSQEKVDRQRKRSLFDVFSLADYVSKDNVGKKQVIVANYLAQLQTGSHVVADSVVKECLDIHKNSIEKILEIFNTKEKGQGRTGFLSAATLYYEKSNEKAIEFCKKVRYGEMLTNDDPCMRLRRYLLGESSVLRNSSEAGGRTQLETDYKKTLYAINCFHIGKKISQLKESSDFDF